jgi:hypothetical protein
MACLHCQAAPRSTARKPQTAAEAQQMVAERWDGWVAAATSESRVLGGAVPMYVSGQSAAQRRVEAKRNDPWVNSA